MWNFVHIPKNAGSSIRNMIQRKRGGLVNINYSGHWFSNKKLPNTIVILREPIDRFVSAFYYRKKVGYYRNGIEYKIDIKDPEELVQLWIENDPKYQEWVWSKNHSLDGRKDHINWVYLHQHLYITDESNLSMVMRQDNLKDDFEEMCAVTMNKPFDMIIANKSKRTDFNFSKSSMEFLQTHLKDDIKLWERFKDRDTIIVDM